MKPGSNLRWSGEMQQSQLPFCSWFLSLRGQGFGSVWRSFPLEGHTSCGMVCLLQLSSKASVPESNFQVHIIQGHTVICVVCCVSEHGVHINHHSTLCARGSAGGGSLLIGSLWQRRKSRWKTQIWEIRKMVWLKNNVIRRLILMSGLFLQQHEKKNFRAHISHHIMISFLFIAPLIFEKAETFSGVCFILCLFYHVSILQRFWNSNIILF